MLELVNRLELRIRAEAVVLRETVCFDHVVSEAFLTNLIRLKLSSVSSQNCTLEGMPQP
jgi:hypothetical protein